MYIARYSGEQTNILQAILRFGQITTGERWLKAFHESVERLMVSAEIDFALRLGIEGKRFEKLLIVTAPEARVDQLKALAEVFLNLNGIIGGSAGACLDKLQHDEILSSFPSLHGIARHEPYQFKDCAIACGFRLFSSIENLLSTALKRGWNISYQANLHRYSPAPDALKRLRKNLVRLELERAVPKSVVESQKRICETVARAGFLIDELIGVQEHSVKERVCELIERDFGDAFGKLGFQSPPLDWDVEGNFDGYVFTGLHTTVLCGDSDPVTESASSATEESIREMLLWRPPSSWNCENVILKDRQSSAFEEGRIDYRDFAAKEVDVDRPVLAEIVSPLNGESVSNSDVAILYRELLKGDPITAIAIFVDGKLIGKARGLGAHGATIGDIKSVRVKIPERDCEIKIIAENRSGAGRPIALRLKWAGASFVIKPKLYLLSVGVSKYEDGALNLFYAAKDANDFAEAMCRQEGFLYQSATPKVLLDEAATKEEILDGLDWIQKQTTSKDLAMIFFAGHGVNDAAGRYFFLPTKADRQKLLRTCVPFSDIKMTLESIAGKALFFLDTCHSGNVMGRRSAAVDIVEAIEDLSSAENGAVIFASSTGKQSSHENALWNNGAFTKALVEGVEGAADYKKDGRITVSLLEHYIYERVKELTGGDQTPTVIKPQSIQDFPIAVIAY